MYPAIVSCLLVALGAAGVRAQALQSLWGQCGGVNWTGPTACVSGAYCSQLNPWYFQCLAGGTTPTTPAVPVTTPPTATTLSTSIITPATSTTTPPAPGSTTCPAIPDSLGAAVSTLPDPFTFASGGKVTTRAQWTCRQDEISQLFQKYEVGTLPPKPSSVSASFSGSTLSIVASHGGKTVSFSVSISGKPATPGPHPAIISFGAYGASIPVPAGVATIAFNNDDIAAQADGSSRGKGKFYDLYGSGHSAGALAAWAWGVARIIDALELTAAQTGIDAARVGVTGCSRNGKGALVAGALERRVALTLPQESGAGGAGCWRLEAWQNANGYNVQDAKEIVGENVWFSPAFNGYVGSVDRLPFDHHMLAGLVAPRPLYVMENPDFEWLGKVSTYGCMGAARKQYQALGALNSFGYSQVGGHNHCSFPSGQAAELNAFIGKFLLGNAGAGLTSVFRTDQSLNFNIDTWSPWTVPSLV
ncbi:hypothetical protein B0T26DRAFT_748950 [Lasiosphaeria miniovina]|uniref:(4-O-methyl)-D-glucuronate--lignin esterase n=1 Tax=Lasiosphaeria miniovina TaxID=1954250 RepID=A0AA40B6X4_9PEZI|nr:uncharacterized protein B0T26DRAFT_748950 [Lasiosphaeria miniovina]KAK0728789.1 hypothetical protein B0T26DRAFT_748950 [Lasiosphaeria miniovina]